MGSGASSMMISSTVVPFCVLGTGFSVTATGPGLGWAGGGILRVCAGRHRRGAFGRVEGCDRGAWMPRRACRRACCRLWLRQDAELLQEAQGVLIGPFLGDLAVFDAVDRCRGHRELAAGGGDPGKVSFVYAVGGEPGHDLVAFGDLILDFMSARRGVPEHAERLLETLPAGADPRKGRW